MEHKEKNLLILGLLAIVVIMGVGYAAFSTQLNINGTASIDSRWDVHIKSITAGSPVGSAKDTGASVAEGNLTATFGTELTAPGDSVTYTVVVENTGTLDAKLSALTFNQTNNGTGTTAETGDAVEDNTGSGYEGNNAIVYSYDGIEEGNVLKHDAGQNEATFTVTVAYNSKIAGQPDEKELTSKLKMTLTYTQDGVE